MKHKTYGYNNHKDKKHKEIKSLYSEYKQTFIYTSSDNITLLL